MSSNKFEALVVSDDSDNDDANIEDSAKIGKSPGIEISLSNTFRLFVH